MVHVKLLRKMCVSMIAFRGRLLFRQYNPSKSHKYGIKMYKLCTPDVFTWASSIYCGTGPALGTLIEKLKKGQFIARQKEFITILKWHYKRDVLMLSTCHGDQFQNTGKTDRKGNTITKPKMILDYNNTKQGIDVSDQLSSYYNPQRKSLVWYKKVVMELLFGITVVNSMIIFNKQVNKKLTLLSFTESLSRSILCTEVRDKSESVNIKKKYFNAFS